MKNVLDSKKVLQAHPVILYQLLDNFFKDSGTWLEWDVESLLMQLKLVDDPVAQDKVAAVKSCVFNFNMPTTKALAFEKTTVAFCNNACVPDSYQPPFMPEVFYTVNQLQQLAKETQDTLLEFTGEVPGYIAAVAKLRKTYLLPKPLEFAQDMVTFLTGYTPDADTLQLIDNMEALAQSEGGPGQFRNDTVLDSLTPDTDLQDGAIAALIGCYLYDPTGD
jgi:hypothetical protein